VIDPAETHTWPLRVVRPGSREPASGVPVSLLDAAGNPAGYWVSDAAGLVPIPRIDATRVRLRIGLRSEEPQEIDVRALEAGNAEVTAPASLLPALSEERLPVAGATTLSPAEALGHDLTLRFSRLAVLPLEEETETAGVAVASQAPVDFFETPVPATRGIRYGALVELELYWQSLGFAAGDLLYTGTLAGGEELAFDVFDARWRWSWGPTRAASRPARPVELIARLIAGSTLANALAAEDGALPLEPFTLSPSANGNGLPQAAVECVRELLERAGHAASTLRRRALRVSEAIGALGSGTVRRVIKNPDPARPLGVHFFEPVERFRIGARAARVRPAVLIPFQLPNLATRAHVQRFATPLRRVLLDRTLLPDLDWVIGIGRKPLDPDVAPPVSELRLVVQTDPQASPVDLRQVWCFLHADQSRYAVHFFPADPPAQSSGGEGLAPPRPTRWIGAIRLADFHQHPLKFPGHLALENGSRVVLSFAALHLEGRAGDHWKRLLSIRDFVLNKESQAHLASLAALAEVPGVDPRESRLLGHIAANLPYYAAAMIAAGDPTLRYLALSKVVDKDGRSLADVIENRVVGIVGNYIACPLRTTSALPAQIRQRFAGLPVIRTPAEITVTVPLPGLWLSQQSAQQATSEIPTATEVLPDDEGRERRLGGRWRASRNAPPAADTA
jgi:hypothetical protein